MKVKSIELKNVKAFETAYVELAPTINLIIGANNSGKSTIIRALQNLQYTCIQKTDYRSLSDASSIVYEITDISKEEKNLFFTDSNKSTYLSKNVKIAWCSFNNNSSPTESFLFTSSNLSITALTSGKLIAKTAQGATMSMNGFQRFSDNENQNNFIYPFLARRKNDYYDAAINHKDFYKVLDGLRYLGAKVQKLTNASHPKSETFNTLCEDILGFKIGVIPSENQNGVEPGIYVNDSSMIPVRAMGEGVANIVGLLVILLTENNKLFLIEELENDIHPEALKKLLTLIIEKSHNNQFVISTHSHIVTKHLGTVPNSKIFFTEWELLQNKDIKIPTSRIEEIDNTPAKRIEILEKLGYELFDFELHEGYLLLEESTAEKIIRDFLIPNFVPGLYGRIKTIAAKGIEDLEARFIDFHRLFVYIHLNESYFKKAWVIADGDSAGKKTISRLKKKFANWPETHFQIFKMDSFEMYYPERFSGKVKEVFELPHGKAKQEEKSKLIEEVMDWAINNRDSAIKEFKISAGEVIAFLAEIDTSLKRKKTNEN